MQFTKRTHKTWRREGRDLITCKQCDRTVTRHREDHRFCSPQCRAEYWRDHRPVDDQASFVRLSFDDWLAAVKATAAADQAKLLTRTEFAARFTNLLHQLPVWA